MSNAKDQFVNKVKEIQDSAEDDKEVEMWQGCYSAKAMFGSWITAGLVTVLGLIAMLMIGFLRGSQYAWISFGIVILLIWLTLAGIAIYHKWGHYYVLTTQRLKHRDGIVIRTQNRIELIDMDDVVYRQGPIQAMLNVGDITIKSSDITHPVLVLKGVDGVREVAEKIDNARRTERRRRGLHIEAV